MSKFYKQLFILSTVLLIGLWAMHQFVFKTTFGPWPISALLFYSVLTALIYYFGSNALNKSQKTFMMALYGGMGMRFIFSIFFIVIYLIINKVIDKIFIVEFLLLYLFYTMFEIYHLVTKLRSEK